MMSKKRSKAAAALAAAVMLAVAVSPLLLDDGRAAAQPMTTEDEEGYGAIGFLAGLAIGLAIGAFAESRLHLLSPAPDVHPGPSQHEIDLSARSIETNVTTFAANTALHLVSSVLPADSELWQFTTTYWERSAEYGVADNWSTEREYDADMANAILTATGLPANASNYLYTWSEAIDCAYGPIIDHAKSWKKTDGVSDNAYSPMRILIRWDGGSVTVDRDNAAQTGFDVCQAAASKAGADLVYIDTDYSRTDISYDHYQKIYALGGDHCRIRNVETGDEYELHRGPNDTKSVQNVTTGVQGTIPSGIYRIPGGTMLAGPLMPVAKESADVVGALALTQASLARLFLADGDAVAVYDMSGVKLASSDRLELVTVGGREDGISLLAGRGGGDLTYNIVRDYTSLIRSISRVISNASAAAEATWGIYTACKEVIRDISVSAVTSLSQTAGRDVTVAESVALTVQTMSQVAKYYAEHQGTLDGLRVMGDLDSLGLVCYGTIYLHGTSVARDVAFTPYLTGSSSNTLKVGTNAWRGSGYAMVWGLADSFSGMSAAQNARVDLSDGMTIELTRIAKDGTNVGEVDLASLVIHKSNTGGAEDPGTPDVPHAGGRGVDWRLLVVIIAVELMAIIALLYAVTGFQPILLGIPAVATATAAWYFWDGICSFLGGLWPFRRG